MINNDRWSALSMKDRAALIDIYVKSGIIDLGEIRNDYNSFGDGGDTESPVDGGEIEASIITPRQSRMNKRRMRKELFTKIKSTLESNGDIIQLYNSLPDDQRKRALESVMKFSSAANPKIVKDWFIERAKKHPLKAIKALDYVITGNGQPVLFEPNRKYAYNGLFGGDYYFDKQTPIDNGIVDAMLYNREINPDIGVQADKQDYGPEVDYINRVYPNKNVQYIETRPGTNLNQEGIQSTIYYGAQGSFKTSLPKRVINNQGIIIQEGIRNDSTFVRGLDVYDFKPDEYTTKWVSDSSMFPIIKQIDEDTNPVAIKTPWVYKDNINDIISSRTGLNGFEFNTIDSDKSVYKTQKALGGKLNKFVTGGPIEPIYYDDTYIEPAVVKAFKSQEEYNRYQGKKGAKAVRRGMNKAANTIAEGLRYTPVVGDVMDGLEAYEEAKTGNLTKAGVLAGLTLLPNALEKPVKAVGKGLKNLRLYNRYVKDVKRFEEPVQFALKGMEENYDVLKSNFPEMNTIEDARRTMNTTVSTRFKPLEAIKNKTLGDYTFDNGEIWLNAYAPIRLKQAWKSPKHSIKQLKQVAAHEGTHSALDNLNITLNEKSGNYYRVIPGSAIDNKTKHLYTKAGREGTAWQNLPEEFIAEMNAARYTLGEKPGSSIDSWSVNHANRSENYLSKRFKFEPGEAGELIDIYEGFGFNNGGFLHIDPFNLTVPQNEDSIIIPYKSVVTSEMNRELIQPTQDKASKFVETMYPIIEQTLIKKGYSTKNINNILRQMTFESDYGLSPRGNGYNLSGIKSWNKNDGTKHSDGFMYRNFKDYSDYADFYIDLLNNRFDAINAKDSNDYIYRLHHGKNGEKYSSNETGYMNVFNNMRSLDKAIEKYLNK